MGGFQYCFRFFRFVPKGMCPSKKEFMDPVLRDCIFKSQIKNGTLSCCKCHCPCRNSEPAMLFRMNPFEIIPEQKTIVFQLNKQKNCEEVCA